jgi:2-polyprenyl-3-methyl-5-hydroxy-6-metoxy-1,4-benzoquinol methylase
MKYEATIDLENKNNSHTLAYDLIEEYANGRALKVLEVGCSGGYFGATVRTQGHTVWGVEPDYESSQTAKEVLDFAFNGTLDDFYKQHENEKFDVIVFGDVLEHFPDPSSALEDVKAILNNNGAIVASVPNVSHITVRAMLLEGRWEYNDLGIMDRTHLQFFTEQTLVELFASTGFNVEKVKQVKLSAIETAQLVGLDINKSFIKLVEESVIDPNLDVFQNLVLARFSNSSNHMNVKNPAKLSSDFQDLLKQNNSLEQLSNQLLQMKNSTSWRQLKAPLRYIASLFRK